MGSIRFINQALVEVGFTAEEVLEAMIPVAKQKLRDKLFETATVAADFSALRVTPVRVSFQVDPEKDSPKKLAERREVVTLRNRFSRVYRQLIPVDFYYQGSRPIEVPAKGHMLKWKNYDNDTRYIRFVFHEEAGWRFAALPADHEGW